MHWVVMRRFLSIATVLALLSSMTSPLLAATCTGKGKAVSCHGGAMPHCDRPMHHHHDDDAAPEPAQELSAGESDAHCPMDCCTPGHPQNGAPATTASNFSPLALSGQNVHVVPVPFLGAGFSSHTDRGPPTE